MPLRGIQPGGLVKVTLLTGSGTFTPNGRTQKMIVRQVGGGAGGGGAAQGVGTARGAAGGGSGAFAEVYIDFATAARETYAYVAGAQGAQSTNGNNAGNNGAASTFTGNTSTFVITTPGGTGGTAGAAAAAAMSLGGAGGVLATTTLGVGIRLIPGQAGGIGSIDNAGVNVESGVGGDSEFGPGAPGVISSANGNAAAATSYGAGGAGAGTTASTADKAGGAGANGAFMVYEYTG